MTRLRIAIVVHGRFHSFDLARELLQIGHDVKLFTNYPAFVAARFGIPAHRVHTFLTHGVVSRLAWKILPRRLNGTIERLSNTAFGRWAAAQIQRENWDVIHSFSGVSEELLLSLRKSSTLLSLARGSTHIVRQRQLLDAEQARAGSWIDKPSDWIVAREQREYELADAIFVLGEFAYQSFLDLGFPPSKIYQLRSGVQTRAFRGSSEVIEERIRRIRSGQPLQIINIGTFCLRKGALDLVEVIRQTDPSRFRFRFVGPIASDAKHLRRRIEGLVEFQGKKPQMNLPGEYAWGDIFVLPTIEEGFAGVIPQALASGLPIITTPNSGAVHLVQEGRNGWMLPARRPDLLLNQLLWCDAQRERLVDMVRAAHDSGVGWDWSEMARLAETYFLSALAAKLARNSKEQLHVR